MDSIPILSKTRWVTGLKKYRLMLCVRCAFLVFLVTKHSFSQLNNPECKSLRTPRIHKDHNELPTLDRLVRIITDKSICRNSCHPWQKFLLASTTLATHEDLSPQTHPISSTLQRSSVGLLFLSQKLIGNNPTEDEL